MKNNDTPIMRYSKTFISSFLVGIPLSLALELRGDFMNKRPEPLAERKTLVQGNYAKSNLLFDILKQSRPHYRRCAYFATFITAYNLVQNTIHNWDFSRAQSLIYGSLLLSPIILWLVHDNFVTFFFWRAGALGLIIGN
jgi:hypothetical protein